MWKRPIDLPVWLSPLGILLCCGSAPLFFPLVPRYGERLADVRTFAPTLAGGLLYAALLSLLFFLCWLSSMQVKAGRFSPRLPTLLAFAALCGLPLLFVYPINADDIFRYFLRGRVTVFHGASPFISSPAAFAGDPLLRFGGEWANRTSPYGPVWEAVAAAIVFLARGDLLASLVIFKAFGLTCHLATGCFLYLLLRSATPSERTARTLLWLWNPGLLLMFVVDAHNDALMLFWLVAGFWLVARQRKPLAGFSVMMLGPLSKVIGVLALSFAMVAQLRREPSWPRRAKLTAWVALVGVCLTLALFAPFGGLLSLAKRIIEESQGGVSFSPLAAVRYLGNVVNGFHPDMHRWQIGATALFVSCVLGLLAWTARGRREEAGIADTFFLYVWTAARYRIWYSVWIFPWALIDLGGSPRATEARLRIAYLFLWTSQISVVIYGHVYVEWLSRSRAVAHFIGVPFVFLLPLLLGLVWIRRRTSSPESLRGQGPLTL